METNTVPINESIISLLLKLHSQLSGCLDSFSLDDDASEQTPMEVTPSSESCDSRPSYSDINMSERIGGASSSSDKLNQSSSDIEVDQNQSDNRIGQYNRIDDRRVG
jgi:hypothetical protein